MFTEQFDKFACFNDTITCEVDGFQAVATIKNDSYTDPPWEREDGHGPVSGWEQRPKAPGERILSEDGNFKLFYNFQEALQLAKKDGWDTEPLTRCKVCGETRFTDDRRHGYTTVSIEGITETPGDHEFQPVESRGAVAARAVEADFQALRAWSNDEWCYCGIEVAISREGIELACASLWGIELNYPKGNNNYLRDVANDLLPEAVDEAQQAIKKLCCD